MCQIGQCGGDNIRTIDFSLKFFKQGYYLFSLDQKKVLSLHLRKLSIWMITKQIYDIRVFKQMILLFVNAYCFVIQNKIITHTHTHTHTHILSLNINY